MDATQHPLDGIASKCQTVLKECDVKYNIQSNTYSKASRVANLIYGISKLRYKQGKGDPCGFKHFIQSNNIKSGMFYRYVGKMLHVLFHLAGVIFTLRDELIHYFTTDYYRQRVKKEHRGIIF